MSLYVLGFRDISDSDLTLAGGKGYNLGKLTGVEGLRVPEGFCISTKAYKRIIAEARSMDELLDRLLLLKAEDRDKIGAISAEIRRVIEGVEIPKDIEGEIAEFVDALGVEEAYAVRSSATAEDLPIASFAGQQDTYLNVRGKDAILKHVSKCWASLFTERAVTYRIQNGFDHRKVQLAVVVQKMVLSQVSGIMFTADPVTSSRKVVSIDAGFGLGEALVSGLVNADVYKVRAGEIIDKSVATKKLGIYGLAEGGTIEQEIEPEQQQRQALTDEQIRQLADTGRKIEQHFGRPQDIEWCLVEGEFYIVQSRPITTLFPVPEENDQENHVYLSVGHQQMMTDPIKPLGLSFFLMVTPAPMRRAAGRLFVDVTPQLASPAGRNNLLQVIGKSDPLIGGALTTILERGDFVKPLSDDEKAKTPDRTIRHISTADFEPQIEDDPGIPLGLIRRSEASIEELKRAIGTKSGLELLDFIQEDIRDGLKKNLLDPQSSAVFMTALTAWSWINEKMEEWLGEKGAADVLSQSVPNNITSEMGLALMDVADAIRPYPRVMEYLQSAKEDNFLDDIGKLEGGQEARDAINVFLSKYGMRCAGEIDITRPRWSEKPATLIPLILGNIKNFEPNAGKRRYEQGKQEALEKERDLTARLKQLPDGERKAEQTGRMISYMRDFIGYREYPKYGMVSRYFVYKQALMQEAGRLVQGNVIREKEDIFFLSFDELREVVRTQVCDYEVINKRKDEYKFYERLSPPRVFTSDGEILTGKYNRENMPTGAIAGLAVSSGVVEGRARVVLRMEDAALEEGDILVTAFTDPSWTPLFVSIKGLVTEVGGLMTHGAVIAREYGLPAVVGVEGATSLIEDGQRIRVNGTDGYVQILQG